MYAAVVTRIHTRPHPNADKLQLGTVAGNQVVVDLSTADGELGVFFPTDGQLSEQMCLANGLYTKAALEQLGLTFEPAAKFGFFDKKRRVRSQRFRGEKSDGFWVPLTYLSWADTASLAEGDTFTELGGLEVCQKYYTPATLQAMRNGSGTRRRSETSQFQKHADTSQFRFISRQIPAESVIYVTEKLHGTSGRYGLVLDDVALPWWKRFINRMLPAFPERAYRYLHGSRNVIIDDAKPGFYGTNEFRHKAVEGIELRKGEVLYFELVGYVNDVTPIMHPQAVEGLPDIKKRYGDTMRYTYGTVPGQTDLYVYKIVRTNEDGDSIELSWPQLVARANELGLKTPPLLFGPSRVEDVIEIVEALTTGASTLDARHIREGVVIRMENYNGTTHAKNKSFDFGVLEGYIKNSDTYVDLEEAA